MGYSVFAGCDALKTLVVPDSHRLLRYRLDRWEVPSDTQIVLHGEIALSLLFAEMTDPNTDAERRRELHREIRKGLVKTGHRRKEVRSHKKKKEIPTSQK